MRRCHRNDDRRLERTGIAERSAFTFREEEEEQEGGGRGDGKVAEGWRKIITG